jgi:hypothetical protein
MYLFDSVIPGWPEGTGPESITTVRGYGFRARDFVAPRNDIVYFFTSGQRDCSSDWNAWSPGTVAKSL